MPGMDPTNQFVYISSPVTVRPRGSTPIGKGRNRSMVPDFANGQATGLEEARSLSPTHRTRRPGCTSDCPSGHTQPSGRARAAASLSRLSMTSPAVVPAGRSMTARQPLPSRVIGSGKWIRSSPFAAALSEAIPKRVRAFSTIGAVSGRSFALTTARVTSGLSAGFPARPSPATTAAPVPHAASGGAARATAVPMPTRPRPVHAHTNPRNRTRRSRSLASDW